MSDMPLEIIAKIFIVLVVLSLSVALIGKFYADANKIDLSGGGAQPGQQTIGPLESTTSEAVGALAANCYKRFRSEAAASGENACYFLFSNNRTFEAMGVKGDGILAASGLNASTLEVRSLASDKLLIVYMLDSDKVIIR